MASLNCRNHGTNKPRSYGNGQENAERDLGVLFFFVCAAEKTASGGWGIHGTTDIRSYGEARRAELRNYGKTELRKQAA